MEIVRKTLGPAGAWWVRERFEKSFDGDHLRTGTRITAVRPEGGALRLDLSDGRELAADHVIAATGFEVDVRRLSVLGERLLGQVRGLRGASGPPRLGAGFDSSVPGLHIVGLASAATFGPAMRFVFGAAFAARTVAARLPH
jgi:NADPH-dependent 2,4-dienoyl-CoA reductase/sulfur reductase-like enzyme